MAESIVPALAGELAAPLAIFGHSMGALVAYELTLLLEAAGTAPEHLFVSGRRPPDDPNPDAPIHQLSDDHFVERLAGRYGAVPDAIRNEPELLAMFLPVLRGDVRALETYVASSGARVRAPVSVYGGADDRHPRPDQLAGWQRVAARPIELRTFPGDHFYLNTAREALTADIAAQWSRSSSTAESR
jgi:medium-chain acyl-[acyl-carrier-protein] hydrolase